MHGDEARRPGGRYPVFYGYEESQRHERRYRKDAEMRGEVQRRAAKGPGLRRDDQKAPRSGARPRLAHASRGETGPECQAEIGLDSKEIRSRPRWVTHQNAR